MFVESGRFTKMQRLLNFSYTKQINTLCPDINVIRKRVTPTENHTNLIYPEARVICGWYMQYRCISCQVMRAWHAVTVVRVISIVIYPRVECGLWSRNWASHQSYFPRFDTTHMRLRWGRVAACLSSSSGHQPVDRHSSRRGWRQTHASVWWWSRRRANVGCGVVVAALGSERDNVLVQWQVNLEWAGLKALERPHVWWCGSAERQRWSAARDIQQIVLGTNACFKSQVSCPVCLLLSVALSGVDISGMMSLMAGCNSVRTVTVGCDDILYSLFWADFCDHFFVVIYCTVPGLRTLCMTPSILSTVHVSAFNCLLLVTSFDVS